VKNKLEEQTQKWSAHGARPNQSGKSDQTRENRREGKITGEENPVRENMPTRKTVSACDNLGTEMKMSQAWLAPDRSKIWPDPGDGKIQDRRARSGAHRSRARTGENMCEKTKIGRGRAKSMGKQETANESGNSNLETKEQIAHIKMQNGFSIDGEQDSHNYGVHRSLFLIWLLEFKISSWHTI
jgi:hypothetical protein